MHNPIRFIDPLGLAAWLVHGTFGGPEHWDADTISFVGNVFNQEVFVTQWDGNNNVGARERGAKALAEAIAAFHNANPNDPIRLIGWSHGGNVAILAANLLANKGIRVETLITIATPVRSDHQLAEGVTVGQHLNIYNVGDAVQTSGGRIQHLGIAGRRFDGAQNIRVTYFHHTSGELRHYSDIQDGGNRPIYNHSSMHNSEDIWNRYIVPRINGTCTSFGTWLQVR